jgi:hypothetical protein
MWNINLKTKKERENDKSVKKGREDFWGWELAREKAKGEGKGR